MKRKSSEPIVTGINIGVSRGTVAEVRAAINDILKTSQADESTKCIALGALSQLCEVKNVGVTNNTLNMGTTDEPKNR